MGTVIKHGNYQGAHAWFIENDALACICLPEHGGKLASLYLKEKKFELLYQNPAGVFRRAAPGSAFGNFEACGFDDAFPSIDAGIITTKSGSVPYFDHGEIWTAEFKSERQQDELCLSYESPFLGFHYQKTLLLQGETLKIAYSIRNASDTPFPYIWACHCLVNYRSDMRLSFPNGTNRVTNAMKTNILGAPGSEYRFPLDKVADGETYDFTRVPQADGQTILKYYCSKESKEGRCGYCYPSDGIAVEMRYDANALPYLGFWVTAGGYRGDLNCAFEPSSGFYDSIALAQSNGKCPILAAGAELNFSLDLSLHCLPH